MQYKFPTITHIDDVSRFVEDGKFYIAKKDGYSVINYAYNSSEVFPTIKDEYDFENAIKREFRGIKFNDRGEIICRPYHKFFNFGERSDIDPMSILDNPHAMLEKLDGSMIAPFIVNNKMIWGTKMGDTDVSKQVAEFMLELSLAVAPSISGSSSKKWAYYNFVHCCLGGHFFNKKYTPIFEWCSNKQRIVLNNDKDRLVLTAMRDMVSGEYLSYPIMEELALENEIDYVKYKKTCFGLGCPFYIDEIENIRKEEDKEGYVVRFEDGHMFKIKSDWYCKLHKVKSDISIEKNVVSLLCEHKIDDLYPLMLDVDKHNIENYQWKFEEGIGQEAKVLFSKIKQMQRESITRKQFALELSKNYQKWQYGFVFSFLEKLDVQPIDIYQALIAFISKNCGSNAKFDEIRKSSLFVNIPEWNLNYSSDDE